MSLLFKASLILIFLTLTCSAAADGNEDDTEDDNDNFEHAEEQATISAVSVLGESGSYNFSVTISSPDEGCESYADWWEVISADSVLLYRRVLAHSHVDEQPFTRSGGPVNINENDRVFIRAHMNDLGYGSKIFSGTVFQGFTSDSLRADYALGLSSQAPLPSSCAF